MPGDDLTRAFTAALQACGGSSAVVTEADLADVLVDVVGVEGPVLIAPELATLGEQLLSRGVDVRSGCSEGPLRIAPSMVPQMSAAGFAGVAPKAACAVTPALLGIAASGTVAIDTRAGNAGLLSSLPPHHVVVLLERSIERDLTDALEVLAAHSSPSGPSCVLITGPSRTSDIEMMSVLGVHGPLKLHVLIVAEASRHA